MHKLKPLLPYFRPYRRQLAAGIACIAAMAWIGLLSPLVIGRAIDALKEDISPRGLLTYSGLILAITAVQGIFLFAHRMILVAMSRHIEFDLRNDFFAHLERLELGFFQKTTVGDLMARATNDFNAVRMVCGPAIMYSTNTLFTAAGALVFMIRIHPELTWVALCTLPLAGIVTRFFGQRIHVLFESVQESFSDLSTRVQENLSGARVIRAYAREATEESTFAEINEENVARNRRLIRWSAAFHPLLQVTIGLGTAAVLGFGGVLLIADELTVGQFVTFNLFLGKMVWPMIAVGWVVNIVERAAASFGRIDEILRREPRIRDREPLVQREIDGDIAFRGLSYSYDSGERVLDDIAFEIEAGRTVALVGRTGSGKSTLLSFLPRLLDPPPGALFIDGVDIHRLPLATLRRAIAMVPQESFLFSATLRENLAFGRPDAADREIQRALSMAGLESDVESFPRGLETRVGERGLTLSGGQKQRVALARALLCEPRILVLDDCLSAVDTETEERILRSLRGVFEGRTVFLVSHRISAVRGADRILVLEGGTIVERGRHQELIDAGGIYAGMVRRQMLEEELAAV